MRFSDNVELTAANMADADILAGTDVSADADKKFSLAGLGDWFLNRFTGLSLAGSNQSVKNAIDGLVDAAPYVTPEMFGAKGDGTADDAVAIQAALDSGRNVCFSGGTYLFSDDLRIGAGTVIDLNGSTLTCNTGKRIFNFENGASYTAYNGRGDITLRNGVIIGSAVCFAHAKNILLENVVFLDTPHLHHLEICACADFRIENCVFAGMVSNERGNTEYVQLDTCSSAGFPYGGTDAFYDGTPNSTIAVKNCTFKADGNGAYGYFYTAIGNHGYTETAQAYHTDIVISGCTFVEPTHGTVRLFGVDGCRIVDNVFDGLTDGAYYGVWFEYGSQNATIKNNKFNNFHGRPAIRFFNDLHSTIPAYDCRNAVIDGNIFIYSSAANAAAIKLESAHDIKVVNNYSNASANWLMWATGDSSVFYGENSIEGTYGSTASDNATVTVEQEIQFAEISGTTNSTSGYLALNVRVSAIDVISAVETLVSTTAAGGKICIPYRGGNWWYVLVIDPTTMAPLKNTAVTIRYAYKNK